MFWTNGYFEVELRVLNTNLWPGLLDGQIQRFDIVKGVVVLGVENRGAGFERLAGNGYRSHSTANDAAAFEDSDLADARRVVGGGGVLAEEVSDGCSADAAPDYADSGTFKLVRE
ncbi:hypothetical protein U1Q18_011082 [Sarracenia purpurea var. burkii]